MSQVPRLPDELLIKIFASMIPTGCVHSFYGERAAGEVQTIWESFKNVGLACKRFNALIKKVILWHIPADAACFLSNIPEFLMGADKDWPFEKLNNKQSRWGPKRCWTLFELDLTQIDFFNNFDSRALDAVCALELMACQFSILDLHKTITRLKNLKYLQILPTCRLHRRKWEGDEPASLAKTIGDQSPRTLLHLHIDDYIGGELLWLFDNYPPEHMVCDRSIVHEDSVPLSFSRFHAYLLRHKSVIRSVNLEICIFEDKDVRKLLEDELLKHVHFSLWSTDPDECESDDYRSEWVDPYVESLLQEDCSSWFPKWASST